MNWLAFQSFFLLTYGILECRVWFPHFPQASPVVQFHLYTMILQFPHCLLILNQKELKEDLIWAMSIAQGLVKYFLDNSRKQSLTVLGIAGALDSDFLISVGIVLHVSYPFNSCWSRSDFQHCPGTPVYFWLFCAILLHDPIGVWSTLVYHYCWFPCSILPMLDPNWCTWSQFNATLFRLVPLPLHEFLSGFVHFLGS